LIYILAMVSGAVIMLIGVVIGAVLADSTRKNGD
jgi:hypothetical protein